MMENVRERTLENERKGGNKMEEKGRIWKGVWNKAVGDVIQWLYVK